MKNISKKIIVYDPYLDTLGGGEKYILTIAKLFDDLGYEVDVAWDNPDIALEFDKRLNISFKHLRIIPNFFTSSLGTKLQLTRQYEYLFYMTDGSYFPSRAKHNFIYAMVPNQKLYPQSLSTRLKLYNYEYIVHSNFCKKIIDKWIRKESHLLYPIVDNDYLENIPSNKEKIILSVGRFFKQLHSKRHDKAIEAFKKLKQNSSFTQYKLLLIGGLKKEDEEYFQELKSLANNDPNIIFLPNEPYKSVRSYFLKAEYYWLFTGYGESDETNPMAVEHFGITPLEAMASGCITFAYNGGGPKEVIEDKKTGFLFNTIDELMGEMKEIADKTAQKKTIQQKALDLVKSKFTYNRFKQNALKIFSL
jgi:glycosyltransferase involved in cell wall biosynthesis